MKVDNEFARTVQSNEKKKYDAACKQLLGQKVILAQILKNCVEEFHDCDVVDIANHCIEGTPYIGKIGINPDETNGHLIKGSNTESSSNTEGKVYFDILFYALAPKGNELIKIIINVEAQRDNNPGYPIVKRALYYCSRLISSQYGREFVNSEYENIKKVYSIWICLEASKQRQNSMTRYRISEDLVYGDSKEQRENYDLFNAYIINLSENPDNVDNKVIKLLSTVLSDTLSAQTIIDRLKTEFNIPVSEEVEEEVLNMCNLSEAIEEKGIKKGIEQGIEKGRKEGLEMGKLEAAKSLMKTQNWSLEQALKAIGVDQKDLSKYVALI